DRWREIKAFGQAGRTLAASQKPGVRAKRLSDQPLDPADLPFGCKRAHIRCRIGRVANSDRAGALGQFLHKPVIDALLADQARTRTAALSAGAEYAGKLAIDDAVNIRVIKDDHGGFAAKLQRNARDIVRRIGNYAPGSLQPAGGCDPQDERMAG